jgi:hypothetical protein
MKRILVLPFKDGDVEDGLRRLISLNPQSLVVFPVMAEYPTFVLSTAKALQDTKAKYHLFFTDGDNADALALGAEDITLCSTPLKEILREVTSEDVIALVWEDSLEAHLALHAVEDFAIETWNIENGLEVIEVEFDDDSESDLLFEEMQEALSTFIEAFATYITSGVLDTLSQAVEERLKENMGKKDFNPFDK